MQKLRIRSQDICLQVLGTKLKTLFSRLLKLFSNPTHRYSHTRNGLCRSTRLISTLASTHYCHEWKRKTQTVDKFLPSPRLPHRNSLLGKVMLPERKLWASGFHIVRGVYCAGRFLFYCVDFMWLTTRLGQAYRIQEASEKKHFATWWLRVTFLTGFVCLRRNSTCFDWKLLPTDNDDDGGIKSKQSGGVSKNYLTFISVTSDKDVYVL